MDFFTEYLGEILVGVSVSFVAGLVATVKAFFSGINRMEKKLNELEARLEANVKSDDEIKTWVKDLVKHKAGL